MIGSRNEKQNEIREFFLLVFKLNFMLFFSEIFDIYSFLYPFLFFFYTFFLIVFDTTLRLLHLPLFLSLSTSLFI